MKKVLLLAATSVLAAALLIPTALAGNAPANKVNADLMFTNASGPAHWVFNAHDLATGDKGNVLYEDADGFYTANVIDAKVEAGKATFTAQVTSSTIYYAHAGNTFTWTVYDTGEAGTSDGTSDYFSFDSAVLDWGNHPGSPTPFSITSGNIQIHFNG